ncbi:unnamed protein product [Closterium sp. NIES-65]|nr:unnamed protein product [Closterium sp. NIES-65]
MSLSVGPSSLPVDGFSDPYETAYRCRPPNSTTGLHRSHASEHQAMLPGSRGAFSGAPEMAPPPHMRPPPSVFGESFSPEQGFSGPSFGADTMAPPIGGWGSVRAAVVIRSGDDEDQSRHGVTIRKGNDDDFEASQAFPLSASSFRGSAPQAPPHLRRLDPAFPGAEYPPTAAAAPCFDGYGGRGDFGLILPARSASTARVAFPLRNTEALAQAAWAGPRMCMQRAEGAAGQNGRAISSAATRVAREAGGGGGEYYPGEREAEGRSGGGSHQSALSLKEELAALDGGGDGAHDEAPLRSSQQPNSDESWNLPFNPSCEYPQSNQFKYHPKHSTNVTADSGAYLSADFSIYSSTSLSLPFRSRHPTTGFPPGSSGVWGDPWWQRVMQVYRGRVMGCEVAVKRLEGSSWQGPDRVHDGGGGAEPHAPPTHRAAHGPLPPTPCVSSTSILPGGSLQDHLKPTAGRAAFVCGVSGPTTCCWTPTAGASWRTWVLARLIAEDDATTTRVRGTVGYIDPEEVLTFEISVLSDVYALGLIMLQLLTGSRASRACTSASSPSRTPSTATGSRGVLSAAAAAAAAPWWQAVAALVSDHLDVSVGEWPLSVACQLAEWGLRCAARQRACRPDLAGELQPALHGLVEQMEAGERQRQQSIEDQFVCPLSHVCDAVNPATFHLCSCPFFAPLSSPLSSFSGPAPIFSRSLAHSPSPPFPSPPVSFSPSPDEND